MKLSYRNRKLQLDGGAMFMKTPKPFGTKHPADANNLIDIAALLIEDGNRVILIDTEWGISNLRNFSYYSLWDLYFDKRWPYGFSRTITDVFMTYLHFDHCGGSVQWNKDKTGYEPAFKNANSGVMKIIGNGPQTQS
jgi:glyoxylase-like metal-dependent hydrolase (beta-lactamase superfamily II)